MKQNKQTKWSTKSSGDNYNTMLKTSHTAYRSDTWSHALGKGASSVASILLFVLFFWMKAMVLVFAVIAVVTFCVVSMINLCWIE